MRCGHWSHPRRCGCQAEPVLLQTRLVTDQPSQGYPRRSWTLPSCAARSSGWQDPRTDQVVLRILPHGVQAVDGTLRADDTERLWPNSRFVGPVDLATLASGGSIGRIAQARPGHTKASIRPGAIQVLVAGRVATDRSMSQYLA
jgi:hypothetical protein